jgi:hypothetical protein
MSLGWSWNWNTYILATSLKNILFGGCWNLQDDGHVAQSGLDATVNRPRQNIETIIRILPALVGCAKVPVANGSKLIHPSSAFISFMTIFSAIL